MLYLPLKTENSLLVALYLIHHCLVVHSVLYISKAQQISAKYLAGEVLKLSTCIHTRLHTRLEYFAISSKGMLCHLHTKCKTAVGNLCICTTGEKYRIMSSFNFPWPRLTFPAPTLAGTRIQPYGLVMNPSVEKAPMVCTRLSFPRLSKSPSFL